MSRKGREGGDGNSLNVLFRLSDQLQKPAE
jgi:hypothetical protein